jgi:hypothetical protein
VTPNPQQFASDNYAGICPEASAATAEANSGHVPAYGDDPWTQRVGRCAAGSRRIDNFKNMALKPYVSHDII